jgi:hypothetical protein
MVIWQQLRKILKRICLSFNDKCFLCIWNFIEKESLTYRDCVTALSFGYSGSYAKIFSRSFVCSTLCPITFRTSLDLTLSTVAQCVLTCDFQFSFSMYNIITYHVFNVYFLALRSLSGTRPGTLQPQMEVMINPFPASVIFYQRQRSKTGFLKFRGTVSCQSDNVLTKNLSN